MRQRPGDGDALALAPDNAAPRSPTELRTLIGKTLTKSQAPAAQQCFFCRQPPSSSSPSVAFRNTESWAKTFLAAHTRSSGATS